MSESGCGSEEGEILSDDEGSVSGLNARPRPTIAPVIPLLLDDLSSYDDVFSSDYENSPTKHHRKKDVGAGLGSVPCLSAITDKRKEKENREENVKQKCRSNPPQLHEAKEPPSHRSKLNKPKRLKHKRKRITSVSSESDIEDLLFEKAKSKLRRRKFNQRPGSAGNSHAKWDVDRFKEVKSGSKSRHRASGNKEKSRVVASTGKTNVSSENKEKSRVVASTGKTNVSSENKEKSRVVASTGKTNVSSENKEKSRVVAATTQSIVSSENKGKSQVVASAWEKDAPENSLKKRLMNMLKFSTTALSSGIEELAPAAISKATCTPVNSATKSIHLPITKNELVLKEVENGSGSTDYTVSSDLKIDGGTKSDDVGGTILEHVSKAESLVSGQLNIEDVPLKYDDPTLGTVTVPTSNAMSDQTSSIGTTLTSSTSITQTSNTSTASTSSMSTGTTQTSCAITVVNLVDDDEDDDLEVLRALALESSSSHHVSSVRKDVARPKSVSDTEEDLTQLRLQALHSAVLKKHKARKEKQLALKAVQNVLKDSQQVPISGASIDNTELTTGCSMSKLAPEPAVPADQKWEENSLDYDKTTMIIDMDLDDTSCDGNVIISEDVMSNNPVTIPNFAQSNQESCSEYYVPEAWTPLDSTADESDVMDHDKLSSPTVSYLNSRITSKLFRLVPVDMDCGTNPFIGTPLHILQAAQEHRNEMFSHVANIIDNTHAGINTNNTVVEPENAKTLNKYSKRPNLKEIPTMNDYSVHNVRFSDKNLLLDGEKQYKCIDENQSSDVDLFVTDVQPHFNPFCTNQTLVNNKTFERSRSHMDQNSQYSESSTGIIVHVEPSFPPELRFFKQPKVAPNPNYETDMNDRELDKIDIPSTIVLDEVRTSYMEPTLPTVFPTAPCIQKTSVTVKPTYAKLPGSNKSLTTVNNCIGQQNIQAKTTNSLAHDFKLQGNVMTRNHSGNPFSKNNLRPKVMIKSQNKTLLKTNAILPSANVFPPKCATFPASGAGSKHSYSTMTTVKPIRPKAPVQPSATKRTFSQINAEEKRNQFVIRLGEDSDSDEESNSPKKLSLPKRTIINEGASKSNDARHEQKNSPAAPLEVSFTAKLDAFLKTFREQHDLSTTKKSQSFPVLSQTAGLETVIKPKAPVVSCRGSTLSNGTKSVVGHASNSELTMPLGAPDITPGTNGTTKPTSTTPSVNSQKSKISNKQILPNRKQGTVPETLMNATIASHSDGKFVPSSVVSTETTKNTEKQAQSTSNMGTETNTEAEPTKQLPPVSKKDSTGKSNSAPVSDMQTLTMPSNEKSMDRHASSVESTLFKKIKSLELELLESKLLLNREKLMSEMTKLIEQLEKSSSAQKVIDKCKEEITVQRILIARAEQEIAKASKEMAIKTQEKEKTYKDIVQCRTSVFRERELCEKLQLECHSLGINLGGNKYVLPTKLQTELRRQLVQVSNGIKTISPTKKSMSRGSENTVPDQKTSSTASDCSNPSTREVRLANTWKKSYVYVARSQETCQPETSSVQCPYEANGDCDDEDGCPFSHKNR